MTSGDTSDQTNIIRRQPESAVGPTPVPPESPTRIIRRHPTGSFPALPELAPPTESATSGEHETSFIPRAHPVAPAPAAAGRPNPSAASATAAVSIVSGWATAVIATSLISGWWRTDELFCVGIGFLTAVSAAATIGGLISLLLRRRIGRLLVGVGAIVALMIFGGLFVAGAHLPQIVYVIPVLPLASIALAALPATGRWCR